MDVGIRRTTLAGVARRAGVSRMTVYRRYENRGRLLSALLAAELDAIIAAQSATADTSAPRGTARARLAELTARCAEAAAEHPIVIRVLALDPEELLPLMVERFGSTQRAAMERVAAFVAAGQAPRGDGSIRPGDPALLATTIVTAAQSFVFARRALATVDDGRRWPAELDLMIDGYLRPALRGANQPESTPGGGQ